MEDCREVRIRRQNVVCEQSRCAEVLPVRVTGAIYPGEAETYPDQHDPIA